ncbi:MAG: PAS domain S-box protein [Thermodesulfobacteriota bacterium]
MRFNVDPSNTVTRIVILTLLAVTTFVLMAFGAVNYYLERQIRLAGLRHNLEVISEQLSAGLTIPLWNIDLKQIGKIMESVMRNREVHGVMVKEEGQPVPVAACVRDENGRLVITNQDITADGMIVKKSDIHYNNRRFGEVWVFLTSRFVEEEMLRSLSNIAIGILIVNVCLVTGLFLILKQIVIKPLGEINDYALRVSSGDGTDGGIRGRSFFGELDHLKRSIESMVHQINIRYLELRKSQSDLRAAEAKYRSIFENAVEGIFQSTVEGRFITVNPALARMLGYESAAELMETVTDIGRQLFVDPENRMEAMRQLEEHGSVSLFETQFLRRDGSKIWVSISNRTVRDADGGLLYYEGLLQDITERKRAEEEHARLFTAIEQAAEGVFITDPEGIIRYVNPAFEHITRYRRSEILGQSTGIIESGKHDRAFMKKIIETLRRGEVWSGRITGKKKDGAFYEAEVTASPVKDETDEIINYVILHRDVTREAKLETRLRQAQKVEAIGTLAGGIAHDFNNILTAIIGYTQMALTRIPEDSPARPELNQVVKASSRATELVKQILSFSRQIEQERKPVSVAPIVVEVLKLLRSSIPSTIEIRYNLALPPEGAFILADPIQIHQLLMNLCTNAAQAMRVRGGVLSVNLSLVEAKAYLEHQDLPPGPYVRFEVRDTGEGMEEKIMERIFDPYFTTKGPGEGTGLGLTVVQGIVKNHGGAISVFSEPGLGSVFYVFFPRIGGELDLKTDEMESAYTGRERILFLDDEQDLADLGKEMLESLGYKVTATTDSLEALEIFRARPEAFDLVITDMTMPALNGLDLAKALLEVRTDTPIIICTGYSQLLDNDLAREAGIKELLMKPYKVTSMARTIRQVLDKK